MAFTAVALSSHNWRGSRSAFTPSTFDGRRCVVFGARAGTLVTARDVELRDGTLELELAVSGERAFPGLAWRLRDTTYESFFVRPHQVGNPDAVQYTPVFNDVSAWQLYHGPGYWAPVSFPIGRWFRLRVAFAGLRGEAYIDDMDRPALVFGGLKVPPTSGQVGILVGGPGLHVARFAYDSATPALRGAAKRIRRDRHALPGWWVSDPVREEADLAGGTGWTYLQCEPTGLANLARAHGVTGRLNTVLARATIHADSATTRALQLGYSDRATVFLNGAPLYRGDATYRSRDYRFLGSIGYWDAVYLPLRQGDNELVVAVSESFGGWGVMARLDDLTGISFPA